MASPLGFSAKLQQLRDVLETDAPNSDLERLLRASNFQVDVATESFFERGFPEAGDGLAPSPLSMDREPGGVKRRRSPANPPKSPLFPTPPSPVPEINPEMLHGSEPTALLVRQLTALLEKLPARLAAAVPAAVREHDEAEALRLHALANESASVKLKGLVALCHTPLELAALSPHLSYNAAENIILCDDCRRFGTKSNARGDQERFGKIDGPHSSRGMNIVRTKVRLHLVGETHQWCVMQGNNERKADDEGRTIGMNLGRIVLQQVREHDSDRSYERRVATARKNGTNVGTKMHNRMFVPRLRTSMHAVLVKSIARALTEPDQATGRPRPFSALADKATIKRMSGQMVGLVLLLEGKLTAIFLSTLLAADSTGAGLAELLLDSLSGGKPLHISKELLQRSFTGVAFDGQYQSREQGHAAGLQVQKHVCEKVATRRRHTKIFRRYAPSSIRFLWYHLIPLRAIYHQLGYPTATQRFLRLPRLGSLWVGYRKFG